MRDHKDPSWQRIANYYDQLQASRQRPEAFVQWTDYRRLLTDQIIRNSQPGGSAAIFGAGAANDMDLSRLLEHFESLTLVDISVSAMRQALETYGLTKERRVSLIVQDFVGISRVDYLEYIRCFMEAWRMHRENLQDDHLREAASQMQSQIQKVYQRLRDSKADTRPPAHTWDCVIAVGIHSQLNDTADWIWTDLASKLAHAAPDCPEGERLRQCIFAENAPIVCRFNTSLCAAARQTLITGYEVGLNGVRCPVQGAMQAEEDLDRRIRQGQLLPLTQTELLWPQDIRGGMYLQMLVRAFRIGS